MAMTKVQMFTDKSWSSRMRSSKDKIKYDVTATARCPECGEDICRVFSWVSMHLLSYSLMSPAWLPVIFSLKLSSHHCVKPALIQMQQMIHKFMTRMVQPLAMNQTKRAKPQKTTRSMTADEDDGELPHSSMCCLHSVRSRTSFICSFQIQK